ncbi:hypothetical protein SDC9_181872 [bioreactor metagenome]|uniref:Uncharacterized protein n=1 Tax=bioreactor metagenome TaxID=1076179 RepID=A0A645H8G0_9ZZZZ
MVNIQEKVYFLISNPVGIKEFRSQFIQISCKVYACSVLGFVKLFVDNGHGDNAVFTFSECLNNSLIFEFISLKAKQGRNYLKIVFNPVVNFPQADCFGFFKGFLDFFLLSNIISIALDKFDFVLFVTDIMDQFMNPFHSSIFSPEPIFVFQDGIRGRIHLILVCIE